MPLVVKCNNGSVTDLYLEIIGKAIEKYGEVIFTKRIEDALEEEKEQIIVVARTLDAFKLLIRRYKRVIVWFQGVEPEESYMCHNSYLRYIILSLLERFILKKARFCIFVSEEMKYHYERKYHISLSNSGYYCMPCMNTIIHPGAFEYSKKYSNNYFAYVGSLAVWQKFEDTVCAYKCIEDAGIPNCKLLVYTPQEKEAEAILKAYGVRNYDVDYIDNKELPTKLTVAKYGFIIREDTTVNRVATPTKISTYLSCGLIPIYSECIKDFSRIAKNMKYAVQYDTHYVERIKNMSACNIRAADILAEYSKIFSTYYSPEYHINLLKQKMENL